MADRCYFCGRTLDECKRDLEEAKEKELHSLIREYPEQGRQYFDRELGRFRRDLEGITELQTARIDPSILGNYALVPICLICQGFAENEENDINEAAKQLECRIEDLESGIEEANSFFDTSNSDTTLSELTEKIDELESMIDELKSKIEELESNRDYSN